MEGFSISVGRDVNGGIRIHQSNSTGGQPWSADDLKRVFAEFEASLRLQESSSEQGYGALLAAIADLQTQLATPETSRDKIHGLVLRIKDLSVGTAASLLAAIVTTQIPWVWTAP